MDKSKHGVIVTKRGGYATKTIWIRGYMMVRYSRQPLNIRFRSRMVSDKNQHLCGGWTWPSMKNSNLWIERQLVSGRKPLGSMYFSATSNTKAEAQAKACEARLQAAGLVTRIHAPRTDLQQGYWMRKGKAIPVYTWTVEACHDICIKDIGNLDDLLADYTQALPSRGAALQAQFARYADRSLTSFLGVWYAEATPIWVTGLILGYPIENTISMYLGSVHVVDYISL